ncbi:MAG TPA: type II toxin-antitoxin system VapC family toxin [Rhizomicrobium sp.]|nr:type II toxin-antitoxin system VapC family toxin [Rhizomicrobium sp.]
MRVLLDTTTLYAAAGVSAVSFTPKVRRLLEDPDTVRLVSPVSFNEIAIKANKGLTPLTREHIRKLISDLALTVLPLTAEHSLRLFGLPAHHGDPFDRMLIATALAEDVAIVASDREFKRYKGVRVIW